MLTAVVAAAIAGCSWVPFVDEPTPIPAISAEEFCRHVYKLESGFDEASDMQDIFEATETFAQGVEDTSVVPLLDTRAQDWAEWLIESAHEYADDPEGDGRGVAVMNVRESLLPVRDWGCRRE